MTEEVAILERAAPRVQEILHPATEKALWASRGAQTSLASPTDRDQIEAAHQARKKRKDAGIKRIPKAVLVAEATMGRLTRDDLLEITRLIAAAELAHEVHTQAKLELVLLAERDDKAHEDLKKRLQSHLEGK